MPKGFDNLLTILLAATVLAGLVLYLRPDAPRDKMAAQAVDLVMRAQATLEADEITEALLSFDADAGFQAAGLSLLVLDRHGELLYHGADRTRIGSNITRRKDLDNRSFGQDLLRDKSESSVWHSFRTATSWQWAYTRSDRHGHIIAAQFAVAD